jgi:hypothetical protein
MDFDARGIIYIPWSSGGRPTVKGALRLATFPLQNGRNFVAKTFYFNFMRLLLFNG